MSERILDVRSQVPGGNRISAARAMGTILGLAIHHSASANPLTGLSLETAHFIFNQHVHERGWDHGGYHYVIRANGEIEYALDEAVAGYHAGIKDPEDTLGLEHGQYWNQHYLAICLAGWFENDRQYRAADGGRHPIPNHFTQPPAAQWTALVGLAQHLCQRHGIAAENVRGHRELRGCRTRCPGANVNLAALRAAVAAGAPAR